MANWDGDSPRLRENLKQVLRGIRDRAQRREVPSVDDARGWQKAAMAGLEVPHRDYVGGFRGEGGKLKRCEVRIGRARGVPPARVAGELKRFEVRLRRVVRALDRSCAPGEELDADGLAGVLEAAAWAHAEWVRIHPFANGSGRTARLWANAILLRYGLPPVVTLRPRPDGGYGEAAARAMNGEWQPTFVVFREMLRDYLRGDRPTTPRTRTR
jgi:hypothetical protein